MLYRQHKFGTTGWRPTTEPEAEAGTVGVPLAVPGQYPSQDLTPRSITVVCNNSPAFEVVLRSSLRKTHAKDCTSGSRWEYS